MTNKIIHIGFPKTGTTFLQNEIFPRIPIPYADFKESSMVLGKLVYADPLDYDLNAIKSVVDQKSRNDACLFSFENLAGSPFYYKGVNRSQIPHQLKKLGFNKVMITIRNQVSAIDSYYRQYVVQGGTLSFKAFLDLEDKRVWQSKYFNLNYLKYHETLSIYREVFGEENLLVLNQEMLRDDQSEFLSRLYTFIGLKPKHVKGSKKTVNQSLTNASLFLLRIVNHFTYSPVSPYHWLSSKIENKLFFKVLAVIIDPYFMKFFSRKRSFVSRGEFKSKIEDIYRPSNEKLFLDFKIDYHSS